MKDCSTDEWFRIERSRREAESRENLLMKYRALAEKWLAETGIEDKNYKNITPFDTAKRRCANELLEKT